MWFDCSEYSKARPFREIKDLGEDRRMSITKRNINCKVCGSPMQSDHGIVQMNTQTGVTWWQCTCGRRVRERYEIQDNKIVTVEAHEL